MLSQSRLHDPPLSGLHSSMLKNEILVGCAGCLKTGCTIHLYVACPILRGHITDAGSVIVRMEFFAYEIVLRLTLLQNTPALKRNMYL